LFLVTACNVEPTNQSKAQDLVKGYLNKSLNDPASYESVAFSQVDSLFVDPHDKNTIDMIYKISGDQAAYKKSIGALKKGLYGFHISHTFRFKNTQGGIETKTWEFNLNKPISSIQNIEKDE
jgi:hypothetical protein